MESLMSNNTKKGGLMKSLDQQLKDYRPDDEVSSVAARVAHFLDWAAKIGPGQYIPYNIATKTVLRLPRNPQLNSKEVETLRSRMSEVRKILQRQYGRDLDSQVGIGVRATYDDADTLTVSLPKKMRRFNAAKKSLSDTAALIDEKNVPNTPELKQWKAWLRNSVSDVLRLVGSADFEQKCLPPRSGSDDDK